MSKQYYFFPIFFGLYVIVAVTGRAFYEKREFYPIFAWSLYSKTPSLITRPSIIITSINDKKLEEPKDIYQNIELSKRPGFDIKEKLNRWYIAYKNKDEKSKEEITLEIEKTLLSQDMEYKIVLEKFYSYERLFHKKPAQISILTEEKKI